MSFLDKIKKDVAPATDTAPKANPLFKANPLAKKTETPAAEPKKAFPPLNKKAEAPADKPNPFGPKAEGEPAAEEKPAETKVEAKVETKVEEHVEDPIANAQETAAEAKEEPKAEVKAEEKKEEKPAAKKAPAKKAAPKKDDKKTEEKSEESDTTDVVDCPTTRIPFSQAAEMIKSPFVDEEWEEFRKSTNEELSKIVIVPDMNPATLRQTIADLSHLRQEIWLNYIDTKDVYERLASKEPEGLLERIKKTNLGDGSNDLQRKKAGVEACMNYTAPGYTETVNLFEMLDEYRSRFTFLKGVMDSIQYKTEVLITMNGAMKLEQSHLPAET